VKSSAGQNQSDVFFQEFDSTYASPILQSHLQIVLARASKFVGTKTLCSALKLV
jgi:hypothetical protein